MLRLSESEAVKLGLTVKHKAHRRRKPVMSPHLLPIMCLRYGLPKPVAEWRFCEGRKWRFDWAWPVQRVALEIEGGIWTGGRHTRGMGFKGDMAKYNQAATMAWKVVRCTPDEIRTGAVMEVLREALG